MKLIIFYLIFLIIKTSDGSISFFEASSVCSLDESKVQLICSVSIISKLLPIAIDFHIDNGYRETVLVNTGIKKQKKFK